MDNANQCPGCGNYIIGEYCCTCKQDIRSIIIPPKQPTGNMPDFMKDIFKNNNNKEK